MSVKTSVGGYAPSGHSASLRTGNHATATGGITIYTGYPTSGSSGSVNISTAPGVSSGNITIATGGSTGSFYGALRITVGHGSGSYTPSTQATTETTKTIETITHYYVYTAS